LAKHIQRLEHRQEKFPTQFTSLETREEFERQEKAFTLSGEDQIVTQRIKDNLIEIMSKLIAEDDSTVFCSKIWGSNVSQYIPKNHVSIE
jgi:hypothetical protein